MQLIFLRVLKISEKIYNEIENPIDNQNNHSFSNKNYENKINIDEISKKEIQELLDEFNNLIIYLINSDDYKVACIYLNFFFDLIRDYPNIFEENIIQKISEKLHETKKLL